MQTLVARNLNEGVDLAGKPLGEQTGFVIGTGCNPGAVDLEHEAEKHARKIAAGAEFVFSQPVYDPRLLERFLAATEAAPPIPFFVGILPSLLVGGLLTGLYGFLFCLLRMEDYSLLIGSLGLFVILGIVMYISRKIRWYDADAK